MDIRHIRVYDPRTDNIDFRTYKRAFLAVEAINPRLAYALHDSLLQKVEESEVERGLTLREFLNPENGFFSKHPDFIAVVFMNGRFYRSYSQEEYDNLDLDVLGKEKNAVPFMFTLDQYIRELEVFKVVEKSQGRD